MKVPPDFVKLAPCTFIEPLPALNVPPESVKSLVNVVVPDPKVKVPPLTTVVVLTVNSDRISAVPLETFLNWG